ncbi:peptide ABC transporter substrate-binding protein [Oceanirhabdus sp. W0125-5]|uniref:peptide ABC transporter substrate-binding protein n=1 Tax=Oceanirhabdus sp. W0125-5 TaxID=2999116 RepID=UPI0022F31D55|nr:peptide ABC transporter substrate-binding protein [Oceanirhabdus sp. W0125-5]WBW99391.1 peptide ABC transporter substrate-binding protein [Oceanirhabdus sp. W0125-5]
MKSKRLLALTMAATMAVGGVLTSCGKKDESAKVNEKTNDSQGVTVEGEKIDEEQYMKIFLDAEPKSIDPSRSTDMYSNQILTHIVDGLTRIEQDENGDKIVPGIAKSWNVSDDGLVWTFNLRDAKWSDGVPVTAKDFEYGIKRTLDPSTGSRYAWLITPVIKNAAAFNSGEGSADELGIRVIDEKTIEFTLESPIAYFLDLTYFRVMLPQRQDIVEKYGEAYGSEAEQMVSNGAFTLESWVHDSELTFKKNPTYWNADEVILEDLTMSIVKDESARMSTLFTGAVDLGTVSKPEWRAKFESMDEMIYSSKAKPSASYEIYNQNNKYFKNEKIRKAFIIALNREDVVNVLYRGVGQPAYAWVPPSVQIGGEDFREKVNSLPVKKLIDENPDPKALLIEGLKELGESENPADMTVTMLQSGTNDRSREFAEFEQQLLVNKLGINVKVDYYDWAIFSEKLDNLEYEFASLGWGGDYNDPNTFLEMFTSTAGIAPTGWVNEEYDKLIADAAQTIDQDARLEMFKRAEEILIYEDANMSPWIFRASSTVTRKYAKGVMTPLFGTIDVTKAYTVGRK